MKKLTVLIVDDEPLALERLSDLLAKISTAQLIGAYQNGRDATAAIRRLKPDLVVLDIEMPKVDGFDVVEEIARMDIAPDSAPLIAFVTAYPQFAPAAYDSGALDFLCKPVRLARLETAIERAVTALEQRKASRRLEELMGQLDALRQKRLPSDEPHVWVHHRGEAVRIAVSSIDWAKAEGEYVRLHMGDKSLLMRCSIKRLPEVLSAGEFAQVHRSYLINKERVRAIRSGRGGVEVILNGNVALPVGRKFRKTVQALAGVESRSEA